MNKRTRKLDEKKLREIQMKQGNKGPGARFGGLKEKPKNLKETFVKLLKYISYSKKLLRSLLKSSSSHFFRTEYTSPFSTYSAQ